MFTERFELPSREDLTEHPKINLSSASWYAAAFHLGKYCEKPSQEFMLCKYESKDPRACYKLGKEVTACGWDFFKAVKTHCAPEFDQYAKCMDYNSQDFQYTVCRNTQAVYDNCMADNLQLTRPSIGYFSRPKVLDTDQPKPKGYVSPEFPDRVKDIKLPPGSELPDARHGVRELVF